MSCAHGRSRVDLLLHCIVQPFVDTQRTVGVASDAPIMFTSVGEDDDDDISGFPDLINFVLDMDTSPTALTTRYGFNESEAAHRGWP